MEPINKLRLRELGIKAAGLALIIGSCLSSMNHEYKKGYAPKPEPEIEFPDYNGPRFAERS